MNTTLDLGFRALAAGTSILLMGASAFRLALRLPRVLTGREADLPPFEGKLPLRGMALSALSMLLSRLLLILFAFAAFRLSGSGKEGLFSSFQPLWIHWDARHYLAIAREGYTAAGDGRLRLVFFPLYPWLMRLIAPLTGGDVFVSGTALSIACACVSAALVYLLGTQVLGEGAARRATAYFILGPMSVFLGCCYTESLFLMLTLLACCLYAGGHPWRFALVGAASALTRMPGVLLCGLPLIRLLTKLGRGRREGRTLLACLAQMAIVFSGLALYWALNAAVTGDPFRYLVYQRENWYQQPGTFFASAANSAHYFLRLAGEEDWLWTWGFQLLCMLVVQLLLAFGQERMPFSLAAYGWVYTALVLSPTWLLSGARYLYGLATLPLLLADFVKDARVTRAALVVSGLLLLLFTYGYTVAGTVL